MKANAFVVLLAVCRPLAAADLPRMCPPPKAAKFAGAWPLPKAESCVIQVGVKATQPELYAADRLARDIRRRFAVTIEVARADTLPKGKLFVFALGAKGGNPVVATLAAQHKLPLDPAALGGKSYVEADRDGLDGYVIETVEQDGAKVALIGGVNGRAVIYGADTLFQLLRKRDQGIELARASVRDWASIPWRGSVFSLTPAAEDDPNHDARIRARLNFIDTRYPGGLWLYPGLLSKDLRAKFQRSATEAHRRGMLVYAHIISSAGRGRAYAKVAADFETLLELGADAMWIGYDDAGGGSDPIGRAKELMALAKKRGLSGRRIAHTPPSRRTKIGEEIVAGDYHNLGRSKAGHARFIADVPGMSEALYYITCPPTAARYELAKAVGLAEGKYAWWHNWPRYRAGLLHTSYGGASTRPDKRAAYYGLVPISVGWGRPRPGALREARKHISAVWLNACTGGKQVEFMQSALGFWGWCPEQYQWPEIQRGICAHVFGANQVEAARAFDGHLGRFNRLFQQIGGRGPGIVRRRQDLPEAKTLAGEMAERLKEIERRAPKESMLEPERLERLYLEPMRATVAGARKAAAVCYPEVARAWLDKQMIALLEAGKRPEAEKLLAEVKGKVRADVEAIKALGLKHRGVTQFVSGWEERLSGMDYWDEALKRAVAERKRRAEAEARRRARNVRDIPKQFKALVRGDLDGLLANVGRPPAGEALVEVKAADWAWPAEPPPCQGPWGIGRLDTKSGTCVAIAYPGRTGSRPGYFAEVRADVAVPKHRGRLVLDAFVTDNHAHKTTGYWFAQLWVNDRMVWEEDIAADRAGREWVSVDVTDHAKGAKALKLRFRVYGKRGVGNYGPITLLGPARLRAR